MNTEVSPWLLELTPNGWCTAISVGKEATRATRLNVVTGTFLLNNHYAMVLFDSGSDKSFVNTIFSHLIDIEPVRQNTSYEVELADARIVSANTILRGCTLNLVNYLFEIDLMPIELVTFDVIIRMDWLVARDAVIICGKKVVHIPHMNKTLVVKGDGSASRLKSDFPKDFPDDLLGSFPPPSEKWMQIIWCHGATPVPVARAPYHLAPSKMKDLLDQLQELSEKGFIRPSSSPWELRYSVKFLNHVIDSKGIHVDPAKIEAIKNWTAPTMPTEKWEKITIDFITGLPRTPSGYDSIWVIVDLLTKSAHFLPMKKTDSMEKLTQLYLKEIVCRHGVSVSIISDRDSCLASGFWWLLQKAFGIDVNTSTAYHPQTDGQSERKIQTLEDMLRAYVGDSQLTGLEMIRETTEKTVQIKNRLLAARSRQKSYADVRRKPLEFNVGDMVMLKIGPVAYKLELPDELYGIYNTFHLSNIKKCLMDENLVIPLEEIKLDDKLYFIEEPVKIMDREVKQLKQSRIPIVKV
ncbi:putative reverse transcriptase domain-containing protein [Tanacetum coccineum]